MNTFLRSGIFVLLLLFCCIYKSQGTHLMGGSMTYAYMGMVGADHQYEVTLKIYRYCDATGGGTAPLDFSMMLGVYSQDINDPTADKIWYSTEILSMVSSGFITPPSPGVDCSFNTTVCVEEGIYVANILLPPSAGGYHLAVERCCRNGNIVNLSTPGSIGMAYYCFIPGTPVINSSPTFNDIPVPFICAGDTATIVNNAIDPDGDLLVYSFEVPYSGNASSGIASPDPQFDNNPYFMPIMPVLYAPGYSVNSPFGAGGYASIDSLTGLTSYYIPNQGFYVVAIEIKEYRNGVLIATIRRDLQLISIACPVNAVPVLSMANGSGQTNYVITEGQTVCFPVTFTDPNGDSLFLTSSGPLFNSSIVNPVATLANASGDGIVTSQFCWSTECGMAQTAPYQFTVSVIDNGCPPKVTNKTYSIKVNPSPLPPAPAVSILQTPPGTICIGTEVTFTALPTFGGTNPIYQWQVNGVNVGTGASTYTSSSLSDGDVITVSLTSNSVCVSSFNAVSPPVVMDVNPFAAPLVSVNAVPAGPICAGTNVSFTAVPVNPGPAPVYQWSVNGNPAGTNSPLFSSSTLGMGNTVSVSLTADPGCPSAISNVINMTVNPVLTPSVNITSDNPGAICPGQLVTFRAWPTNGGVPVYQWKLNGVNVGINSNTFTSSTLVNGDNVSVVMTSSESCVTTPTATSNVINIAVTPPTNPTVSITVSPTGTTCNDDNLIFTATPVNGGSAPSYVWKRNGVNTFGGSGTWATAAINNGDQIQVVMTSNLTCLLTTTASSNIITVNRNPVVSASVTITAPATVHCQGSPLTFTATPVNGGTNPFYQWQVNGVNTGVNNPTFTTSSLANGDRVRVLLTSNGNCVSPVNSTSNQITVTITPVTVPAVSITTNAPGSVCDGTSITFTAAPVSGGASPVYQWTVNGTPAGTNSATFISSNLDDGDVVRVSMTSNAICPVPATVSSNQLVVQEDPLLTPTVSIASSQVFPVCEGTPVTFTSSVTNSGTAPAYQWLLNGVPSGNSSTFTISTLVDGDTVKLRMTSNALCAWPATNLSNAIGVEVLPILTPSVNLAMSPASGVCDGDTITFSTVTANGGANPSYQWFLNGTVIPVTAPAYASLFNDNDTLQVVMTSSYQCPSVPTDTSGIRVTTVFPNLVPSVNITVNPTGPVCPGDQLIFTATGANGGTSPVYQWMVNGQPAGTNSAVFSSVNLSDGDIVRVRFSSSEQCITASTVTSNTITVQVSPNIIPDIHIAVSPVAPVCAGDTLSFSATYSGSGLAPQFEWRVNGISSGITTPQFVTNSLNNGDVIDVVITSSAFCALPLTDTSNNIIATIDPLLVPSATITADPPGTFCDGAVITYSATGVNGGNNPAYQWQLNGVPLGAFGDTLVSSAFADGDTLELVYTSAERCLAVNPVLSNKIIIDRLPPIIPEIIVPAEVCKGKEIVISAGASSGNGGPYYFSWDNGLGNGTEYTLFPDSTTVYTVTISDSCSTDRQASAQVVVNMLPVPEFAIDPPGATILNPFFDFIDQSQNTASWEWTFGDGSASGEQNPFHSYMEPGVYSVGLVATSDKGCVDSTRKPVNVENVVIFYIPNSFSPNGDGINDIFSLTGYSVSGYSMNIYNRWGQQVFVSRNDLDAWDGKDSDGKDVQDGVYVYHIKVHNDPENKIRTGTVTVVR